jgi:ATP-binding cassette, subfamily G (WHITE), eye pigment precursor transporter
LIHILRCLAKSGRTIIQTIHQPNSDIFNNFDQLMLLAKGKTLYFNESSKAVDYFSGIGFKCPELTNPSDFFMSIMSIESIQVEKEGTMPPEELKAILPVEYEKRIAHFDESYSKSELKNNAEEMLKGVVALTKQDRLSNRASWCYEFGLLAKRNILNQLRLPQITIVRLFVSVFIAVICIVIYSGLDGTKAGVQNRKGALFFVCINSGFSAVSNISLAFPSERPVFLREANNGMYRVSSYFWSKILSELPMSILIPVVQGALTYYGVGFNT